VGKYGAVAIADASNVTINLTKAEALVLFAWLHRNEDREDSFTIDQYDIFDPPTEPPYGACQDRLSALS